MIRHFAEIDENGFAIGVSALKNTVESENIVPITVEQYRGLTDEFYKAKYENGMWVEGATPEEIEAIENPPDPVDRLAELEAENAVLKAQNKALADKTDFHEDVLAEIILAMHL